MKKTSRRRSSTTTTRTTTHPTSSSSRALHHGDDEKDDDDDTYCNSLYARRNSLMATPTVRRNSMSVVLRPRRHSMSSMEHTGSTTKPTRRGSLTATRDQLCSWLHIGGNQQDPSVHTPKNNAQPQSHKKSLPPPLPPQPSQYTYYQEAEAPADCDNRRPVRDFFTRRRRTSELNNRANAKHELLVSFALGKGLWFSD